MSVDDRTKKLVIAGSIFLVAILTVVLVIVFAAKRNRVKSSDGMSADEAKVAAVGQSKVVTEDVKPPDQKAYGTDFVFDEKGNLVGSQVAIKNIPQNVYEGTPVSNNDSLKRMIVDRINSRTDLNSERKIFLINSINNMKAITINDRANLVDGIKTRSDMSSEERRTVIEAINFAYASNGVSIPVENTLDSFNDDEIKKSLEAINAGIVTSGNGRQSSAMPSSSRDDPVLDYYDFNSTMPRSGSYKGRDDVDTAKAAREVEKMDRDRARESSLVFSEVEGINGRGNSSGNTGSSGGAGGAIRNSSGFNSANNTSVPKMSEADAIVSRQLKSLENLAGQVLNVGNKSETSTSGSSGIPDATRHPLISVPGQVSDMRIGGDVEVIVPEGKFVDCVNVNDSEVSRGDAPIIALVARDFLDRTGKYVLIPAGSRVMGLGARTSTSGQDERMFIHFHRIFFPDGRSAYFPQRQMPQGFNPGGKLGSNADVNNHWWKRFGLGIAMGVVEGLAYSAGPDVTYSREGTANISAYTVGITKMSDRTTQVADKILSFYSNFVPTVSIKPGTRMKLYFSEDIILNAYSTRR